MLARWDEDNDSGLSVLALVKDLLSLASTLRSGLTNPLGSDRNALDLVEGNLVLPPVVELRGPGAFVVGDVLRGFKRSLVLQVRGDAGRPESMVPDPRLDAGVARPPLDHAVGVLLPHGLAGELAGLAGRRLE